MSMHPRRFLAAGLALSAFALNAWAVVIPVPNSDFNDNSDGDVDVIDLWTEQGDAEDALQVIQVDGASGKDPGDLVVRLGDPAGFYNPTVATGTFFDPNEEAYKLTVEARAFATETLDTDDDAASGFWGIVFRDMTNGENIKTAQEPNTLDTVWRDYSLYLTQGELADYATTFGIDDVSTVEIGVRIFKLSNAAAIVGVDNVVLETTAAPVAGDVDGNGLVELDDYAIIRDNLNTSFGNRSSENLAFGDVYPLDNSGRIGDGVVDYSDFRLWKNEFLAAGGTEAQIAAFEAGIPEPSAAVLAVIALAVSGARCAGRG